MPETRKVVVVIISLMLPLPPRGIKSG